MPEGGAPKDNIGLAMPDFGRILGVVCLAWAALETQSIAVAMPDAGPPTALEGTVLRVRDVRSPDGQRVRRVELQTLQGRRLVDIGPPEQPALVDLDFRPGVRMTVEGQYRREGNRPVLIANRVSQGGPVEAGPERVVEIDRPHAR